MTAGTEIKRILVADDYPGSGETLAELVVLVSPFPVLTTVALDGAQAVQLALAEPPDCAILDIEMPTLDGVDAALQIRAALGARAPLLIALTGNAARAAEPRTLSAFDHVLFKSGDVDQLLDLVAGLGR